MKIDECTTSFYNRTMTAPRQAHRSYLLTGPEHVHALQLGLVDASWYHSPIPRAQLKKLVARRNGPASRDIAIWVALLAGTGALAFASWGTWWAIPAFALYGTMYGSVADPRWHECGHGTAFKTQRANSVVYAVASFMTFREPVSWRWSHARHHSDTIIVGWDPEIAVPRPTSVLSLFSEFFCLRSAPGEIKKLALNCVGRMTSEERDFVPEEQYNKAIWSARAFVAVWVASSAWSIAAGSIEPLLFIGLPSFYGRWLLVVFGLTQHAGLAEDVLDHRLNTRTVAMGPVLRFLYWNMNFHIEHHMYPTVPFHALEQLHAAVKDDLPPVYQGLRGAYREVIPALRRQAKEPSFFVERTLIGAPTHVTQ